jgi:hypothetical protein
MEEDEGADIIDDGARLQGVEVVENDSSFIIPYAPMRRARGREKKAN